MRLLATFLLSVTLAQAQSISPAGIKEIDALFQRAVQEDTVPGVVAIVVSKDRILYHNASGLRDVARSRPMQEDSIFRIASMTKPMTSAAILLLREQGKLNLDDPVSKYLPEFKGREVITNYNPADGTFVTRKATGDILIRHLLTHTSGMAYTFSNTTSLQLQQKTGKPPEELPLLYDPGTHWSYSPSTKILGRVVEVVSGVPLDRFLNDSFIKPLDMIDTSYAVPPEKTERVVTTHRRDNGKLTETGNPSTISSPVAGDGGLASTAPDYVKFLQMFLNEGKGPHNRILSRNSIQLMTRNEIGTVIVDTQPAASPNLTRPFPTPPAAGRDKFGYGFEITASNKENPNLRSAGSYTWAGIYNTHFWVDPKRQIAAVLMLQVLPFYDDAAMKLYENFEEAIGRNLR